MRIASHQPKLRDDYLALVREFPLMPIRSAANLKQAHRLIDRLAVKGTSPGGLSYGEQAYLEVLAELAERYEAANLHRRLEANRDGIDRLQFLVEEHGMTASDLGRLLGSRDLGSKILRRERELSKAHILTLAAHFAVEPGLFMM